MATLVPIPKLGQSEETVIIDSWRVNEGDVIKKSDILFEVETDKAVLEVESQFEGTLLKIITTAGKEIPVMTTACVLGEPGEEIPVIEAPKAPGKKTAPAAPALKPAAAPAAPTAAPTQTQTGQARCEDVPFEPTSSSAPVPAVHTPNPSPRARKYAQDFLINLDSVPGTGGAVGRVTERDVKEYLENSGYLDQKITPAAFNIAKQEELELLAIEGTGECGRITIDDVRDAVNEKPQEMNAMRRIIAQRLAESKQQIPHFYVTVSIDMTDLLAMRKQLKDDGINLSVNVFVVKAAALSLKEFPYVNAALQGNSIVRKSKVNVGVAVSVENGLVVPVVRNTDKKALDEIHAEIAELAGKARDGKLTPDEMKGSSFTISNMGMMNVESFGAIINPGEAAIMAVASCVPTPVVKDGEIVVRDMMKVTLSADHRVVDGAMAAEFVNAFKAKLENTESWSTLI
ncbi:MAG: 2-oxo acid dehydrogenase subunit E2 [Lentisphaerae bacterium]|nr:2-oxo acid dehydrogenase subunit E2 [Lentisphaerota bacterium]MCP4099959.1 2-oxo acid dehydrogenase subunit E2 [Lentisphaerota bacterium]